MSHVNHQFCTDFICNGTEFFKINDAGISRCSSHNQLRRYFFGTSQDGIVIQLLRVLVHSIGHKIVGFSWKVNRSSVGQVSTSWQVHTKNSITWLDQGHVGSGIGLATWMGLDIGKFSTKDFFCPFDGKIFNHIYHFCTAIVAFSRITFRVLIGQNRALCSHYCFWNNVFWSNQLDVVLLAFFFSLDGIPKILVISLVVFQIENHVYTPFRSWFGMGHEKTRWGAKNVNQERLEEALLW